MTDILSNGPSGSLNLTIRPMKVGVDLYYIIHEIHARAVNDYNIIIFRLVIP